MHTAIEAWVLSFEVEHRMHIPMIPAKVAILIPGWGT
jgi:hypothetical protein